MRKNVLKLMMTALLMAMAPCVNAQIEVGYILCDGDTLVSPSDFDSLNLAPLGVVFYVDNSGEHGSVVALQDDGLFSWGGYGTDTQLDNFTRRGSAADDLDGYSNTKSILEEDAYYPAFQAVDFQSGWYLPAAGQLKCLYKNLKEVDTSIEKVGGKTIRHMGLTYWSSTEYSEINAWYMSSIGGLDYSSDGYNDNKDGYRFVRSVRNF